VELLKFLFKEIVKKEIVCYQYIDAAVGTETDLQGAYNTEETVENHLY
jgi:hypothetical protein